jgi:hypothetical protein
MALAKYLAEDRRELFVFVLFESEVVLLIDQKLFELLLSLLVVLQLTLHFLQCFGP